MLSNIVILSGLSPYSDLCCTERSCISLKFVMIRCKLKCLMSSWVTSTICHITQWAQVLSSADCVVSCVFFSLLYNDMCACIYAYILHVCTYSYILCSCIFKLICNWLNMPWKDAFVINRGETEWKKCHNYFEKERFHVLLVLPTW